MSQMTTLESLSNANDVVPPAGATRGATGEIPSEADAQAFLEQLADGQPPSEEDLQQQYDKNFQTISYLFMKGIYSHAEEEIKKRQ